MWPGAGGEPLTAPPAPGRHRATAAQDRTQHAMQLSADPTHADGHCLLHATALTTIHAGLDDLNSATRTFTHATLRQVASYVHANPYLFTRCAIHSAALHGAGIATATATAVTTVHRLADELATDTAWKSTGGDWALPALVGALRLTIDYVSLNGAVQPPDLLGNVLDATPAAFTLIPRRPLRRRHRPKPLVRHSPHLNPQRTSADSAARRLSPAVESGYRQRLSALTCMPVTGPPQKAPRRTFARPGGIQQGDLNP